MTAYEEDEGFDDEEYINAAVQCYASDDVVIQTKGPEAPDGIVDRVPGAAWVMAWVYVEDENVDFRKEMK